MRRSARPGPRLNETVIATGPDVAAAYRRRAGSRSAWCRCRASADTRVLTPALTPAEQARIGKIIMTGSSHDSSTFTQIGTQTNYNRP